MLVCFTICCFVEQGFVEMPAEINRVSKAQMPKDEQVVLLLYCDVQKLCAVNHFVNRVLFTKLFCLTGIPCTIVT